MSRAFLTGEMPLTRPTSFCFASHCVQRVSRSRAAEMFCSTHWNLIPSDLRALLERKFRPKRVSETRWTKPFARFMVQARRELAFIEQNGHRIPKAADFMWDEP